MFKIDQIAVGGWSIFSQGGRRPAHPYVENLTRRYAPAGLVLAKLRLSDPVGVCTISESPAGIPISAEVFGARAHASPAMAAPEISTFTLREFLILGVLKDNEMCGSEVARSVLTLPDFGITPGIGIIYPALKTLAKNGTLRTRRMHGRPRVYYSLTDQGKGRLFAIAEHWDTVNYAIQALVVRPYTRSRVTSAGNASNP